MSRFQYLWQSMTLSLTRKGLLATITLSTVLLTLGFALGQLWLEVPAVFLVGILWIVCVLREIRWVASALFAVLMGAAAIGIMAGLPHIFMLAVGCTNVIAWDLHQFEARLLDYDDPATKEIERNHLQRVSIVLAASFVLIAINSLLRIRLQFIVLVLMTLLAILILNQIMLMIRRAGRPAQPKE
jgi:hypothetical protein